MRTGSNWISFSFPESQETRGRVSIWQRNTEWCHCELCRLWKWFICLGLLFCTLLLEQREVYNASFQRYVMPALPEGEHEQFWTIPETGENIREKTLQAFPLIIFWGNLLERFTCISWGYGDIHWSINDALAGVQLPERFDRCPLLPLQQAGKSSVKWQVFLKAVISLEWPLLFQNLSLEDLGGTSLIVSMKGTRDASYLIFIVDCRHADSP